MIYEHSLTAILVFGTFVAAVLGLSFVLGGKAKSTQGYFAAHGQIHWFINGIAFAGDYLSAASFLGICGMIAFYGYDGFLYSIGYLAGWVVALLVIAEPLKRLGKFTFADALDNRFQSRGIKFAAAMSTLAVSLFYLIPQMVGAGTLVRPLLGFSHEAGVLTVGVVVILIVVTAGMVSTTYVQFIKGAMLVAFCAILTYMILQRGFSTETPGETQTYETIEAASLETEGSKIVEPSGAWKGKPYVRVKGKDGVVAVWKKIGETGKTLAKAQTLTVMKDGKKFANGKPQGRGEGQGDLKPIGQVLKLPSGQTKTGPLNPISFLAVLHQSEVVLWGSEKIKGDDGSETTVYSPKPTKGADVLVPGASPTFKGVRSTRWVDKLDFLSLMLALFGGTASLPHILIRYYTVKDQSAVRRSTLVGIATIGFFYILTLYLGLGAMTGGALDVTNSNMAAPLLARAFGELPFAIISAVAFTTVLGTVSGLIMAASGAVAHDLVENVMRIPMTDAGKVRVGKVSAFVVGLIAMWLGIVFEKMNVSFLVGWAFNIAASANLPSLVMLLFWKKTTKEGITSAILVGMGTSLAWVLLSAQAFQDVYGLPADRALVPFSQPGIITIPLGFAVLVGVSLLTQPKKAV